MRPLLLALALLAAPAAQAGTLPTPDAFRAFAVAGNWKALDAALDAVRHDAKTETGDFTEQRAYLATFSTTDPAMNAASRAWLKAEPGSPYAHAARAELLANIGWTLRGDGVVREVNAKAFDLMDRFHAAAFAEAAAAHKLAPDLLVASELIVDLAKTQGNGDFAGLDALVAQTMKTTPSLGFLNRAIYAESPMWGGSVARVLKLCTLYAADIREIDAMSADTCAINAVYAAGITGPLRNAARAALAKDPSTTLDPYRFDDMASSHVVPPEMRRKVAAALEGDWSRNTYLAYAYDKSFGVPAGQKSKFETAGERSMASIRARIKTDPYNPALLAALSTGGIDGYHEDQKPSAAAQAEMLHRALYFQRYSGSAWGAYAEAQYRALNATEPDPRKRLAAVLPLYETAAVYSNYDPMQLMQIEFLYMGVVTDLQYRQPDAPKLSPPPDPKAMMAEEICPALGIDRLVTELCAAGRSDTETCNRATHVPYRDIFDEATKAGECKAQRDGALKDLILTASPAAAGLGGPGDPLATGFPELMQ